MKKPILFVVAAVILTSTAEEPDTPAESTVRRLDKAGCAVYVSQEYHDAVQPLRIVNV